MKNRGDLKTEQQNPNSKNIGTMEIKEILATINNEDSTISSAVKKVIPSIENAVNYTVNSIKSGGRVFYVGAGTSGRLGVLDASEIPPTFSAEDNLFIGIIAGGEKALTHSVEGAEDDSKSIRDDLGKYSINENDTIIGISCSGAAEFVIGALEYAKNFGAKTIYLVTNPTPFLITKVDIIIHADTGPEVITGSTRMKAGTATKMILNMISTTTMIKIGKVYNNLMVDLMAVNNKLVDRGVRIIEQITLLDYSAAKQLLMDADKSVKIAIVMHHFNCDIHQARIKLNGVNGFIQDLID